MLNRVETDILAHVEEYVTKNPRILFGLTPRNWGPNSLNLPRPPEAVSNPEQIGYFANLFYETRAFGGVTEIELDSTHAVAMGAVYGAGSHTYLALPAKDVVAVYRAQCQASSIRSDVDQITESGLPNNASNADVQLPLHFVTWCVGIDRSGGTERILPLDALKIVTQTENTLRTLYQGDGPDSFQPHILREILRVIDQYNKISVATQVELYNNQIVPPLIDALCQYQRKHPNFFRKHFTPEEFGQALMSEASRVRCYINFGNDPTELRDFWDSNRGPATVGTLHAFSRLIPFKRILRLIGNGDSSLQPDEHEKFRALAEVVKSALPGWKPAGNQPLWEQIEIDRFALDYPEFFLKSLDVYGDLIAKLVMDDLIQVVNRVVKESGFDSKAEIEIVDSMSDGYSLQNHHAHAIKIRLVASNHDFGELMELLQPTLQQIHELYTQIYQIIATNPENNLERNQAIQTFITRYYQFLDIDPTTTELKRPLIQFLTGLQPNLISLQNQRAAEACDEEQRAQAQLAANSSAERTEIHLRRFEQHKATLRRILSGLPKAQAIAGEFDPTVKTRSRLLARYALSILALERRGIRFAANRRSANFSRIPGFFISYRYITSELHHDSRLEVTINVAGNERGSVEAIKGIWVRRAADELIPSPPTEPPHN